MAKKKKKCTVKIIHHGLYAKWSNRCRELPRFLKFTDIIPGRVESEFGCTIEITGGKGKFVDYTIEHPPLLDSQGAVAPSFTGQIPLRANKDTVYLGDTLWEPLVDKLGKWRVIGKLDGEKIADFTFTIISETTLFDDIISAHALEHIGNLSAQKGTSHWPVP